MNRGNPNQKRLVEKLIEMGYETKVIHNQICVKGQEPMTIVETKRFIEGITHHATIQKTLQDDD